MNQPCTEQAIRDNEQLAELDLMYKETERALVLIGDRMREIKNRLQKKPPVGGEVGTGNVYIVGEPAYDQLYDQLGVDYIVAGKALAGLSKLAGSKYEK